MSAKSGDEKIDADAFLATLRSWVDRPGEVSPAPTPVNEAMIRHWCQALGDRALRARDRGLAMGSGGDTLLAPAAMLDTWAMPGLAPRPEAPEDPFAAVYTTLERAGFASIVATDTQHAYDRDLVAGDRLTTQRRVVDVSQEKETSLGCGHFVTTVTEYRDVAGNPVGRVRFRVFKFRPASAGTPAAVAAAPAPSRPRPGVIQETRFFWDGLSDGELRIQECQECRALHHPPVVRCPGCGSHALGHRVASGRGEVYSCVEVHHPQVPPFQYPLAVALVELEEGTRLIANVAGVDPDQLEIGTPLEFFVDESEPEAPLPSFRPRRPAPRTEARLLCDFAIGERLPTCPVPVSTTLIVAGAIASRDYQDVHHDRDAARRRGLPDIFMNIMTTGGLAARYVGDWAGPTARIRAMKLRLGVPNHPGDTLTLTGEVDRCDEATGLVSVVFRGVNRLGAHVTGRIELALPMDEA